VVGYVVAVSFVELSTLVYPISKSGPTQTSVLVQMCEVKLQQSGYFPNSNSDS
jgi:hypothetical protein